jgi:hypothetical protein
LAGERRWQRDFLQKMEAGVDGRVIFKPAGSTYREAAAYLSALAYVASGRSALPPRAVGVVAQRVLPLAAAAGEKMFSQAAAWLWRFPDTQDILFSLFPHLDLRDREFGGFVRGAFKRDPFLWDGIFRRLMG